MMKRLRTLAAAIGVTVLTTVGGPGAVAQVTAASPGCATPPCGTPISSSQLRNLTQLKNEIKTYYTNGSYLAEVSSIEDEASRYLDQRVHDGVKKPALVLDIDDTALSTFTYEVTHDFGYDPISWNDSATKGFPAIAPTLALANHAHAAHVTVFFITGRRVPQTDMTRSNLAGVGYTVDGLYLRPLDDASPSVVPFKSSARANIESKGYTVLETIGDQWSDLDGGHAERAFKLPNPMYFLP